MNLTAFNRQLIAFPTKIVAVAIFLSCNNHHVSFVPLDVSPYLRWTSFFFLDKGCKIHTLHRALLENKDAHNCTSSWEIVLYLHLRPGCFFHLFLEIRVHHGRWKDSFISPIPLRNFRNCF
jgi:hypothetical protein